MSSRNKRGTCAYCSKQKKLTKDHVPPKLFLEQPFPPNLWTVPACAGCNESFKADDEYVRTVLAVDLRANWNNAAQVNLPMILRSLERRDARGFASYLAQQSTTTRIVTPSGSAINVIEPDKERLNRAGIHIMRGLYFRETGKAVPADAAFWIGSKAGLTADHPDMLTIARVLQILPDHRDGATGSAFSYFAGFGDRYSLWVMLLYDFFFWVGSVDERQGGDPVAVRDPAIAEG